MIQLKSTGNIILFIIGGMLLTMLLPTAAIYAVWYNPLLLWLGLLYAALALLWLLLLIYLLRHKLSDFTDDLCQTLDTMMDGSQAADQDQLLPPSLHIAGLPGRTPDEETLFARLHHRLTRLYSIMEAARHQIAVEREELQSLVSDISHQVKTPLSNLKMLNDTLLSKNIPPIEQTEFLLGIQSQTEKLDFLFGVLVKSSRLETGLIRLERRECRIYDTLAQALSGIVYDAELKKITVAIQCPEMLCLSHDSKWTAEALFNLLDNAVKYTPTGGHITITAEEWELYVKLSIRDTGKGIAEDQQAQIYRRFYREEDVHDIPGIGIGLYLTREIITRQGGYIKLNSSPGNGATFSIYLPKH